MIELLTNAEMGECDRLTIAGGTPGIVLMENAGRAVADATAARTPANGKVVVVAGPGNNGGDGFVAARLLAERNFTVELLLVGEAAKLKGDAAEAARRWRGAVVPASPERIGRPAAIVDALFGAGLDRPVEGLPRAMIEAMNAAGCPIVAVDLASGVNGTTGAAMGTRRQRGRKRHLLSREARTLFTSGPASLRTSAHRRHRHRRGYARESSAAGVSQQSRFVGAAISGAGGGWT